MKPEHVCPVCGVFADDGLGAGYMTRHWNSLQHVTMVEMTQQDLLKFNKASVTRRWLKDEGPWLVEEEHVSIEMRDLRELRVERVEEVELLIQKGRVFHIPLPGKSGTALCGLVLRSYELVDRFKLPVGEALFRICEVCDNDGALQQEELERVQLEIKTCSYCLGVFPSVQACKAHEEDCGL